MNDDLIKLRVVTPSGPVVEQMVSSITTSSEMGEFCVLPEHRPVLASLKPGRLMFEVDGEPTVYAVDIGFFESSADHVNVMTQHCVSKESIEEEIEDLQKELGSLQEEFSELEEDSPARTTLEAGITWLQAQLEVAQK